MNFKGIDISVKLPPELDGDFIPASIWNRAFLEKAQGAGNSVPAAVALERGDKTVSVHHTRLFPEGDGMDEANCFYMERLIKTLLWIRGGRKIYIFAPVSVCDHIRSAYGPGGIREFDAKFMARVYEKPFEVEAVGIGEIPPPRESARQAVRHLGGCRIGLDLGGSDRKVSAVIEGDTVYSEEVVWHPKTNSDPQYHFDEIVRALRAAAAKMPRVDAVGISSAGIYVNNRVMIASLFLRVPDDVFDLRVKSILTDAVKELGDIPMAVANDGDVAALAGAMELNDVNVLGIAMGTSEAGGYVDRSGNITGWLNELCFVPVDLAAGAAIDEWSGDSGCGVKYFSQDAVTRLAPKAGICLDVSLTPAEKLKRVQELLAAGEAGARKIFEGIGSYLGYGLAHYADFYDIRHVLILGRVTSGEGGNIIVKTAAEVLSLEFPELASKIKLHLPDESSRRVGQSIAAASLVDLHK